VSGESHLGHARPYITFDVVYRYLLHLGYKVRYVRNITDAGHFEEEGREAEDKISKKAQIEKLEPMELVQKYTNMFHWAMQQFNNLPPSIEPAATGHIVEQINMIEAIIAAGYAYEKNAVAGKNVMVIDSTKCMIHAPEKKLVILQGLDDFIVVDTKDALLICQKEKEQEIKDYVAEVKRKKGDKFL
jgi:hypothetical protein